MRLSIIIKNTNKFCFESACQKKSIDHGCLELFIYRDKLEILWCVSEVFYLFMPKAAHAFVNRAIVVHSLAIFALCRKYFTSTAILSTAD